jgi:microsomal prostaglandin-E synthase 2
MSHTRVLIPFLYLCPYSPYLPLFLLILQQSKSSPFLIAAGIALAAGVAVTSAAAAAAQEDTQSTANTQSTTPQAPDIVLLQYQVCPYCCKVRAFLDFHNIPYRIVEVNPVFKSELKFSKYKKVPVILFNGEQVNDSTIIIDALETSLSTDAHMSSRASESLAWVDSHLVKLLPPNIYRSAAEAVQAFTYITDHGNFNTATQAMIKYVGAAAMYAVARKKKKEYGIQDERKALYDALDHWLTQVQQENEERGTAGAPFFGGDTPSRLDLAVYGVLSSIEGLRAWNDCLENTKVGVWYFAVKHKVGTSACTERLTTVEGI